MKINTYLNKSKWKEICDDLKLHLKNGEYSVGESFYTLDEICKKFNVSRITATKVFQELKNEGWILPVRRRGTVVNRSHIQKNIFFVVGSEFIEKPSSAKMEFFVTNKLLKGLHAGEGFYNVKITPIDYKFFFSHIQDFINRDVVMLAQFIYDFKDWFDKNPSVFQCLKYEVRPVLLHAFEDIEGFSVTRISYEDGIRLAVEHLIKKGHKNIACITGDINFPSFYLRFKGFTDTLKVHSIPLDLNYIKDIKQNPVKECIQQLLSLPTKPTAVVCASDAIAIDVLVYCVKNSINVPKQLAVAGFDNRGEAELSNPPLTTVDSKLEEQGKKAVELIMQRATGKVSEPVVIKLEPELIIRESA